jgi:hypothetical protein
MCTPAPGQSAHTGYDNGTGLARPSCEYAERQ